jgi:hypothetical protein
MGSVFVVQTGAVVVNLTVVSRRLRVHCLFTVFFQMLSMTTENGMCCVQCLQMVKTVDGRQ